jgi:hypothetical protein
VVGVSRGLWVYGRIGFKEGDLRALAARKMDLRVEKSRIMRWYVRGAGIVGLRLSIGGGAGP